LLLRVGINRLAPASRAEYMSQYLTDGADPYFDRLEKNSFMANLGDEQHAFVAALPESAVFNHDCRPNLVYHFDPHTLAQEMYVVRDIKPGEEMTVSYIPPYENSTRRDAKLASVWGFKCHCALCKSSPSKKRASDRRLNAIQSIIKELNMPFAERDPAIDKSSYVKKALQLVKLHEQEGLWGSIAGSHMYVALEKMWTGENKGALEWALKARESLKLWTGTGHPYYLGMLRLVRDLEDVKRLAEKEVRRTVKKKFETVQTRGSRVEGVVDQVFYDIRGQS